MIRAVLIACALAACVQSNKVVCSDGRICPPGSTCDLENQRCTSPEQSAACEGRADDADCEVAGAPGVCRAGACDPLICGDNLVFGNEACDDDALSGQTCESLGYYRTTTGLACTDACQFDTQGCEGYCNDGTRDDGVELCDMADLAGATCQDVGFYDAAGLGCTPLCTFDVSQCTGYCGA